MTALEKEYGGALYELAAEEHIEDAVLDGLGTAVAVMRENPRYLKLLANPAVEKETRLALLEQAFRGAVHDYVLNFIKILCEKKALDMLPGCETEFCTRLCTKRGILPVTAWSAVAMDASQTEKLKQKLAALTGKTILLENKVDTRLLGGVKLVYEGKELDGTVRQRLGALRTALLQ